MNIYLGNIDFKVREEQLAEIFSQYGEVSSVKIITDKFTKRSKGFGFVEMPNDEEGRAAVAALNGADVNSRAISVAEARPREERPERSERPSRY
jgi:RNA recognition motif-containing protein